MPSSSSTISTRRPSLMGPSPSEPEVVWLASQVSRSRLRKRHCFLDDGAQFAPRDEIFNRFGRLGGRRGFQNVDVFWKLRYRRPSLTPDPVTTQVQRDPV